MVIFVNVKPKLYRRVIYRFHLLLAGVSCDRLDEDSRDHEVVRRFRGLVVN